MSNRETIARIAIDRGRAVDLLDPAVFQWKMRRRFTLLTVAKVLSAIVLCPTLFFSVFLCLWALAALMGSLPTVTLTCFILLLFIVALSKLAFDRWWGDDSVSFQGAVLSSLSGFLLFAAISLFAFIVAELRLIDGKSHSLYEWSFYFSNLLSYNVLAQLVGDQARVSANQWHQKAVVVALNFLFYSTVITTLVNFVLRSFKRDIVVTGTQLDLWAHLSSPVYFLEDFDIRETGRLIGTIYNNPKATIGGTHRRKAIVKVGGYGYPVKQLVRYFILPWTSIVRLFRKMPTPLLIRVCKIGSAWTIDDSTVPDLRGIPFDECMTEMIDFATRHIIIEENGFASIRFSEHDFFGSTIVLEKTGQEGDWILYKWKVWGVNQEDALRGKLYCRLLPFAQPPAKIYAQATSVTPTADERLAVI
jgi:hypothetical protein